MLEFTPNKLGGTIRFADISACDFSVRYPSVDRRMLNAEMTDAEMFVNHFFFPEDIQTQCVSFHRNKIMKIGIDKT